MSSIKHTPGPWIAVKVLSGLWQIFPENRTPNTGAISVLSHEKDSCDDYRNVTTEANARLIAAAPELLEALQEYVYMQEGAISKVTTTPAERLKKAQQAIQKATHP